MGAARRVPATGPQEGRAVSRPLIHLTSEYCASPNLPAKYGANRAGPSEPFSETPAHRGPDHASTSVKTCAVVRNPNFSRCGSGFLRNISARNFMRNLCRPPEITPSIGACVELRISCCPLRRAAIRTRFPTRCCFRPAIDRAPRSLLVWLSIIEPYTGARDA